MNRTKNEERKEWKITKGKIPQKYCCRSDTNHHKNITIDYKTIEAVMLIQEHFFMVMKWWEGNETRVVKTQKRN